MVMVVHGSQIMEIVCIIKQITEMGAFLRNHVHDLYIDLGSDLVPRILNCLHANLPVFDFTYISFDALLISNFSTTIKWIPSVQLTTFYAASSTIFCWQLEPPS